MATVKVDISGFVAKIDLTKKVLAQEVETLVNQAAELGAQTARGALDLAVTDYGSKRFAAGRGGSAGRNDTGSMINDLRAYPADISKSNITAKFGWGRGRSKAYYAAQENGTSRIRGAFSLLDGERAVLNELPRLFTNMKARIARATK